MKTPAVISDWLTQRLAELSGARPGQWLALDDNAQIVDEDSNGNALVDRIAPRPDRSRVHIVHILPREFQ